MSHSIFNQKQYFNIVKSYLSSQQLIWLCMLLGSSIFTGCVVTIWPSSLFDQIGITVWEGSFSFLFAVTPLSHVGFSWGVSECSSSVFFAVIVLAIVLGSVGPGEDTFAVEISIFPLTLIDTIIGVPCGSKTMRDETSAVDIALILSSFFVDNSCLIFRVVIEDNGVGFIFVAEIFDDQITGRGLGFVVELTFEWESVLGWVNSSLTFNFSVVEISFIDVTMSVGFKDSMSMGNSVEISVVCVLFGFRYDSFSLLVTGLTPVTKIVHFLSFMFVDLPSLGKIGKIWVIFKSNVGYWQWYLELFDRRRYCLQVWQAGNEFCWL